MARKRRTYECPPKACPRPADLIRVQGILPFIIREHAARMNNARSGASSARRAEAKRSWPGRKKKKKG